MTDKLSLEHTIRNIAEGKVEPSENKVSLEHAIRNIQEGIGVIGTDKFQGSQFKTVRTVTPVIKPGHNERSETASNARNAAKATKSLTMQGKVSESAPSDTSGVTLGTMTTESGKKKKIDETPAPNYGNAASVAQWPAAESGKKKVKEEVEPSMLKSFKSFTEVSKGTEERREVDAVGRPDTAKNPMDPKSKIYKQGQIKTKIIDEEKKEKVKLEKGVTPVDTKPVLKNPPIDGQGIKEDHIDEGLKEKLKRAGKVAGIVSALGGQAAKIHSAVDTATNQPGLAAATMTAGPISKISNMLPTALKADKAGKGEDEFKRQEKFIRKTPSVKKEETEMDKEILEAIEFYNVGIEELSAFGKEYAAHKGAGQGSVYKSKVTGQMIKIQDKKPSAPTAKPAAPKPTVPSKPMSNIVPDTKPPATTWADPGKRDYSKDNTGTAKTANPAGPEAPKPAPKAPDINNSINMSKPASERTESGKKMKEEVENPLIAAFLALQDDKTGNMFEAAKSLSPKQKKIAAVAGDKSKIDAEDFKALRGGKKMEEDVEQVDEISSKLASKASSAAYNKYGEYLNKSQPVANEYQRQHLKFHKYAAKANEKERTKAVLNTVSDAKKKRLGLKEEDVAFSESELEFFNSVMEAGPVAKTDATDKGSFKKAGATPNGDPVRPTVPTRDLTDSVEVEEGTWSSSKWSHPRPMNLSSGGGLSAEKKKALADRMAKYKPNMKAGESDEEYKARTAKNAASQRAAVGMKEETLEEGRPKKNPTPEATERDPRQHIQVIAGQAAAGRTIDFKHNDGSVSKIDPAKGRKIVAHLNSLKPAERQHAVNKMHDSSKGL